jgi:exopolyphosphatase/guanosine-5'-triphosphate,3'-diphosphate pyrophosphatase
MRVATIDIGTNTVLLLVAERDASGAVRAVLERATITRLGEGVDRTRALAPAAVERTRRCLEEYAHAVESAAVDRVAVVGTSAMRDASGGEEVRSHVARLFGVEATVLAGQEEARLAFVGALSGLRQATATAEVAVFDIGGGSTEVILGRSGPAGPMLSFAQSFDVGSVRLTERFCASDPPAQEEVAALRAYARECFRAVPALPANVAPVGVAGTMTTLAAVQLGLAPYDGERVHGLTLPTEALASTVLGLAVLDTKSRVALPGMEPKRADVIVAGGLLALELLAHWRAANVVVSDRGVRWGMAEELLR